MKEDTLSFGEALTHEWKHIFIDFKAGVPILFNDVEIGGFLVTPLKNNRGLKILEMQGIELDPEYRRNGIGRMVVQMLLDQCDMMIGSITDDPPKPFWKSMGAEFRPIPRECFGKLLPTVHTEEPIFFFITKNPVAKHLAEIYAVEVPKVMRQML